MTPGILPWMKTSPSRKEYTLKGKNLLLWDKFFTLLQSTLVISKSKGPSKTVRDIRTSTYQICSIEEKTIRTTNFTNDYVI